MLLVKAIAYLEDKSKTANDRFKVLTGFDSTKKQKIADSDSLFWFNDLYTSGIFTAIEGVSGYFSSLFSGNNLETQLRAAFKKAIAPSTVDQEAYIKIVVDYLKKNQEAECLIDFEFTDPDKLLKMAPVAEFAP